MTRGNWRQMALFSEWSGVWKVVADPFLSSWGLVLVSGVPNLFFMDFLLLLSYVSQVARMGLLSSGRRTREGKGLGPSSQMEL